MNPFGPGDGGIPYPPLDIPVPETPPADFSTIGQKFAEGQKSAQTDASGDPWWLAWIPKIVQLILGTLLKCLLAVLTWMLRVVFQVFNSTDSSMNQLAATALQGMTGLPMTAASFSNLTDRSGRQQAAQGIATIFSQALLAATKTNADGTIAPTADTANKFMEIGAHMAIEGWLQGWIVEMCTWDKAERFADLKDTLEQCLGVGRLARRAMAAPMKVFVEDPYTQLLNKTYHPTLLSPGEAVRFYLRGGMDRTALQTIMDLHGYQSTLVDELIWDQKKGLSAADLQMLVDSGQLTQQQAVTQLNQQGYDNTQALALLQGIQQANITARWEAQLQELGQLYVERKIDQPTWQTFVDQSKLPSWRKDVLVQTVQFKAAANRTRFSMAEGETLVKKGLWTLDQFRDLATYHGYQLGDETDLELLMLTEMKDAADAAAKKQAAANAKAAAAKAKADAAAAKAKLALAEVEAKGVSTAEYETLVTEGLRTPTDYYNYLVSKQVAPDNAQALVTVLQNKIQTKNAAAAAKTAAASTGKVKKIDLTQLETAVKQGLLSMADFITRAGLLGLSSTDAQLIAQELQNEIDAAAAKAKATADAKAAAKVKGVDLSQEERAVRLGLQTVADYQAFLTAHGYTPESSAVLVSELQAQLATDQQTAAKKQAAAQKAASKGISLSQLERLVRAGVKTPNDYQQALITAGVDASDQAALMQYLNMEMTQDQDQLITKGKASALVGQLGVSLTDLERAVKLGVVPIDTYQSALARAGVSAQDQQTMVQTLAAQIKTTKAAQSTAQSVSKQVAAAGLSLATLEKDTTAGKLSTTQLQGLLAGYGVSDTDAADVVSLVQDEIDNAKAVEALVNQATARAAAKGLDLAQDTAAYKAGVMDEATWRSRVASLGYDDADVEILFETLAAAQAATAAKAAAKAGTSTTAAPPAGTSAAAGG